MSGPFRYYETGGTDPCYNLAFEEYLLKNKTEGDLLMLWQNDRAVIVGLNQNAEEEIDRAFVADRGISVVRRTTGGGAVYHDLGNLNYSFITDTGKAEALRVAGLSRPLCQALEWMGLPVQLSGRNDLLLDGKKISGVAQRIYGSRILHHGTLLFDSDLEMMAGALRADPKKFASKSTKSVRGRVGNIKSFFPSGMELKDFWQALMEQLGQPSGFVRENLSEAELESVRRLADEKYRSWDWNYGRSPAYCYKNRERFDGGTLQIHLNVENGRISGIDFFGDYMASESADGLKKALLGVPYRQESLREVLSHYPIERLFGAITLDEILILMFRQ